MAAALLISQRRTSTQNSILTPRSSGKSLWLVKLLWLRDYPRNSTLWRVSEQPGKAKIDLPVQINSFSFRSPQSRRFAVAKLPDEREIAIKNRIDLRAGREQCWEGSPSPVDSWALSLKSRSKWANNKTMLILNIQLLLPKIARRDDRP